MIDLLINLGFGTCCIYLGWFWRDRLAAEREAALLAELRRARKIVEDSISIESTMYADNKRLAEWCGRFRDMYLDVLQDINPKLGAELRAKWAHVQAPEAVNRLLQRVKHG